MTEASIFRGHCPTCGPNRKAFVQGKHTVNWADGDVYGSETGLILECCGCEALYFRKDVWFSEWDAESGPDTSYWPVPTARKRPEWLVELEAFDRTLGRLVNEVYDALDADLRVLTATGIRTAFDRTSELLGIDPKKTFADKLNELVTGGNIGTTERDILGVLVDAGGAAAHRGWTPSTSELSTMMDVIEAFLHRSFVVGEGIKRLRTSVPPR